MAATSLSDLYQFEKHFEDAAETFLTTEVGIDVYASISGENFVTPRLEIQFISGEAELPDDAPITSVPALSLGEYRKYGGEFEVRVITDAAAGVGDPSAILMEDGYGILMEDGFNILMEIGGQTRAPHFNYVGKVRASLLRSADNWDATTLPYYGVKFLRQAATSRETDGDLQITTISYEIKFSIRSDAFPTS
mgnify:CR=1 FL=1